MLLHSLYGTSLSYVYLALFLVHISFFLSGTIVKFPPPCVKEFNIENTGVKIDLGAIELPANATALVFENGKGLVCRTTDQDESKEGAEPSEVSIKCKREQVIGTSLVHRGVVC